jgi:hypothetical protein
MIKSINRHGEPRFIPGQVDTEYGKKWAVVDYQNHQPVKFEDVTMTFLNENEATHLSSMLNNTVGWKI